MTALDFMMACIGVGILLISAAHSYKVLSVTRSTTKVARELIHRHEDPPDPLGRQLHEFRNARFGREMTSPRPSPRQAETWPVMRPRQAPPEKALTKDKERGEKKHGT